MTCYGTVLGRCSERPGHFIIDVCLLHDYSTIRVASAATVAFQLVCVEMHSTDGLVVQRGSRHAMCG